MPEYKIEKCNKCGSQTHIGNYRCLRDIKKEVNKGKVRCWACSRKGHFHTDFELAEVRKEI